MTWTLVYLVKFINNMTSVFYFILFFSKIICMITCMSFTWTHDIKAGLAVGEHVLVKPPKREIFASL